jgi:hypothetical protein
MTSVAFRLSMQRKNVFVTLGSDSSFATDSNFIIYFGVSNGELIRKINRIVALTKTNFT